MGGWSCKLGFSQCLFGFFNAHQGQIEKLQEAGIPDESHDLIISNCVVRARPILCLLAIHRMRVWPMERAVSGICGDLKTRTFEHPHFTPCNTCRSTCRLTKPLCFASATAYWRQGGRCTSATCTATGGFPRRCVHECVCVRVCVRARARESVCFRVTGRQEWCACVRACVWGEGGGGGQPGWF